MPKTWLPASTKKSCDLNKRGRSWDFPDHTNWEELEKLYKAKIGFMARQLAVAQDRIEQLEAELSSQGVPLPEEILDAYIVTDLDEE
jgi:hypothetical protein